MATGMTLLAARTKLRVYLNETAVAFWSDNDLNMFIADAAKEYWSKLTKQNPDFGHKYYNATYPASTESVMVTPTAPWLIKEVTAIEDRTTRQPGVLITPCSSLSELRQYYPTQSNETGVLTGIPTKYYVDYVVSETSGVISQAFTIYAAPYPISSLSLRVHFIAEPLTMVSDDHTTGLTDDWDKCVIFRAGGDAAISEGDSERLAVFKFRLQEAENMALANTRPLIHGNSSVTWDGDD
jgi:hypothetical protein